MLKEDVYRYLVDTYNPKAVLFMGSYMDGTADEFSDFDCAIIVPSKTHARDESVIDGVMLDCDIYSVEEVLTEEPATNALKCHDAEIVLDDGIGMIFMAKVKLKLEEIRVTTPEEKQQIRCWMEKTSKRSFMADDNGNFRAVMLLWESLPYYFMLRDIDYFGGKKAIRYLMQNDPKGYALLHKALETKDPYDIKAWSDHVTA